MNTVLKIRIIASKNTIVFQILEMDERLRVGDVRHSFTSSSSYRVQSWDCPEITETAVFIRGKVMDLDDAFSVFHIRSTPAKDLLEKVVSALLEYAEFTLKKRVFVFEDELNPIEILDFKKEGEKN